MKKKIFLIITLSVSLVILVILVYVLSYQDNSFDDRTEASLNQKGLVDLYVYPNVGDCSSGGKQLGVDCWEEATGIQEAIDAVPNAEELVDHRIFIREGTYIRSDEQELPEATLAGKHTHKCNFLSKDKNVNLIGEGINNTIINGIGFVDEFGLCVVGGKVSISEIHFDRFGEGDSGIGTGIVADNAYLTMQNNRITSSRTYALVLIDGASGLIYGNELVNNNYAVQVWIEDDTSVSNFAFKNNIFDVREIAIVVTPNQRFTALFENNLIRSGEKAFSITRKASKVTLVNNVIQAGRTGISTEFEITDDFNIRYNAINAGENILSIGGEDRSELLLDNQELDNIFEDPILDWATFRLQDSSPCRNTGDPDILNPDGSRSDIGAYGGPGACLLDESIDGCRSQADLDGDGEVNMQDYSVFVRDYLKHKREGVLNERSDLNSDETINMQDYALFVREYLHVRRGSQ